MPGREEKIEENRRTQICSHGILKDTDRERGQPKQKKEKQKQKWVSCVVQPRLLCLPLEGKKDGETDFPSKRLILKPPDLRGTRLLKQICRGKAGKDAKLQEENQASPSVKSSFDFRAACERVRVWGSTGVLMWKGGCWLLSARGT